MKKITILILAVLLVGGGVFWLIQKDEAGTNNSNANQDTTQQTQQIDEPEEEYLVIEEWSIRFKLPEQARGDITYKIDTQAQEDFGGPVKVNLFSAMISNQSFINCSLSDGTPREVVSFYQEIEGETGLSNSPPLAQLGNVRYQTTTPSCAETLERENAATELKYVDELKSAIAATLENI